MHHKGYKQHTWHFSDAAKLYVPIVDLGATNVAKTAPRTNRVAATAKISVLVDEIGLDERIVVRGGLVLYIVVSMLIVGMGNSRSL